MISLLRWLLVPSVGKRQVFRLSILESRNVKCLLPFCKTVSLRSIPLDCGHGKPWHSSVHVARLGSTQLLRAFCFCFDAYFAFFNASSCCNRVARPGSAQLRGCLLSFWGYPSWKGSNTWVGLDIIRFWRHYCIYCPWENSAGLGLFELVEGQVLIHCTSSVLHVFTSQLGHLWMLYAIWYVVPVRIFWAILSWRLRIYTDLTESQIWFRKEMTLYSVIYNVWNRQTIWYWNKHSALYCSRVF